MTTKQTTKKPPAEAGADGPEHPSKLCYARLSEDGNVAPFSLEEQWQLIEEWHRFLTHEKASNYPVLDGLNEAWEELEPLYTFNEKSILERGTQLRRVSANPLSAFFYFVGMGFYPPPELMLTLHDCWKTYTTGDGAISMEEAFIGKPKRGAGNYASRSNSRFRRMKMQWDFADFMGQGLTRIQAAEAVSQLVGGKPDADSILKMFRGTRPSKTRRPIKAEN